MTTPFCGQLSGEYHLHTDYSLGYDRSETLYCAINDNCPNNVFPIFWWPKLANGEQYETLFHRVG
ncbi:phosphoribosyltransferase-like protein [Aeromonas caviae]